MRRARAARPWCIVGAIATAVACDKPAATPAGDTAAAASAAAEVTVTGDWPAVLGPLLVVPSDTESQAVVLYPVGADASVGGATRLALLSPSGDTVRAQAGLSTADSLHCGDAPVARLTRTAPPNWSVGIASRDARPMRSDSLDALGADSTFMASEMARLASAAWSDGRGRFAGIPFTLSTLRRSKLGGREVVAAQLVRRLNQEADPGEEHTFVIAERDASQPATRFEVVHAGRSEGTDDSAEHFELVAALQASNATYFVITRDRPASTTIEILERTDAGGWRVRWTRTVTC